jgi:glycine/D-amino acid oxidase-like deaminating enzyme
MLQFKPYSTGPAVDEVDTDTVLPSRADAVVVGGGIAGVTSAMFLAERGISVVLCEKGSLAAEQSSRNWGWVRVMGRDLREIPLMIEAKRIWDKYNAQLGAKLGLRRSGIVYLCRNERELARRATWLAGAKDFDIDSRIIGSDEVNSVLPGSSQRWHGALYTPSDARAEPQSAVSAFAQHARQQGAKLFMNCAVRGVETKAGRVSAAITERGEIGCSSVILAGGAWSRLFCRNLGLTLPQLKVLASVMRVDGVDAGPEPAAWGPGFAFRKRVDGGYTVANGSGNVADIVPDSIRFFSSFLPVLRIEWKELRLRMGRRFVDEYRLARHWRLDEVSPFERVRILDPEPANDLLDAALRNLRAAFPMFEGAQIQQRWAGLIDATPDALPIISGVDGLAGFFAITGFSGHGFGLGPGAGRLMADLVEGTHPIVDPAPFRFSRFADGSRSMPMTGF